MSYIQFLFYFVVQGLCEQLQQEKDLSVPSFLWYGLPKEAKSHSMVKNEMYVT